MSSASLNSTPTHELSVRLATVINLLGLMAEFQSSEKKWLLHRTGNPGVTSEFDGKNPTVPSRSKVLHDFRIACRRGETALSACEERFTNSKGTWLRRQLHTMRDACNELRDDEVFLKWLKDQPKDRGQRELSRTISKCIKAGFPRVSKRALALIGQTEFRRRIRKLAPIDFNGIPAPTTPQLIGLECQKRHSGGRTILAHNQVCGNSHLGKWLFRLLDEFIQRFPDNPRDVAALHELRIATKRMRYGIEFISDIDAQLAVAQTRELLQEMQEKLGELHDAAVRQQRLKQLFAHSSRGIGLLDAARRDLHSSINEWQIWWQPKVFRNILQPAAVEFSKLLTNTAPGE